MKITLNRHSNREFFIYCLIGGIVTIAGLLASLFLIWLGMSVYLANFLVYFIGCIASYLLNSKFTFRKKYSKQRAVKFFISIGTAYFINVLIIYAVLYYQPNAKYIAQIVGNIFYTLLVFFINKFWVMK